MLWFLAIVISTAADPFMDPRLSEFAFTAPAYKAKIAENARGKVFAVSESPERMGVKLPSKSKGEVRFKIVSGDRQNFFKAETEIVGDFAFLRLRTKSSLDVALNREHTEFYNLLVKATYRRPNLSNLETRAEVILRITDENDQQPLFYPAEYHAEIAEDLPIYSTIVQVTASDADTGLNGEVFYSFAPETKTDLFAVHPSTGVVRLLKNLNVDYATSHQLKVIAHDRASLLFGTERSTPSEAIVVIRVYRVNKNAPNISLEQRPAVRFRSGEDTLLAVLRVIDEDKGIHGEIGSVRIIAGDSARLFHVERSTADNLWRVILPKNVTATETARRALADSYNLTLFAQDRGFPPRNATYMLPVSVLESEVAEVRFMQTRYRFELNETVPYLTPVGFVSAEVISSGLKQMVLPSLVYAIVSSGTGSYPFALNSKTGLILLYGVPLEYSERSSYVFTVQASSGSINAVTAVEISILDQNNHSPQFVNNVSVTVPLSRSTPLETVVCKVPATDIDSGLNGQVSYHIASSIPHEHPFLIDPFSGEIKLVRALQSFSGAKKFTLMVRASDWGAPYRRESELPVRIEILDPGQSLNESDHGSLRRARDLAAGNFYSPMFDLATPDRLSVPEDSSVGKSVYRFLATDEDLGYAGFVHYVITAGNEESRFKIGTYTGDLIPIRPLDRETTQQYRLEITAWDLGAIPRFANISVLIVVEDANDCAPVFEKPTYVVSVQENVGLETSIVQVRATDCDVGDNARIRYDLLTDSAEFSITEDGVVLVRKSLDREKSPRIDLVVKAEDHGSRVLSGLATVRIELGDVNDNAPRCLQKEIKVQAPEDYPVGTFLTCIDATDPDVGPNARLTFAWERSSERGPFVLHDDTGCVWLEAPLDFERQALYNQTIEVYDGGQPPVSTVCHFVVEVVDVNENLLEPTFEDFVLRGTVLEDEPIGTEVLTIRVTDPDGKVDAPPVLSILGGDGVGLFSVDSQGVVKTAAVLDHETKAYYWLTVFAEDRSAISLSSSVDVFIETPHKAMYTASVPENSPPGTLVVLVEATDSDDLDTAQRSPLRFEIVHGNPQSFFKIDSKSGYITAGRRMLDRETQAEHELQVVIADEGKPPLSSTVMVVISVNDSNDCTPFFDQPIYNFDVPASQGREIFLFHAFADDCDSGKNAELKYTISDFPESMQNAVFINESTGSVFSNATLRPGQSFGLTITATDGGSPALSNQTRVVLSVVSSARKISGNKAPLLVSPNPMKVHISHEDVVGHMLGVVEADDPDGDHLWFDVIEDSMEGVVLRKDTGQIQLTKSPKLMANGHWNITYSVTDGLHSIAGSIEIYGPQYWTERPVFESQIFEINCHEDAKIGDVLTTLKARVNHTMGAVPVMYFLDWAEAASSLTKFKIDARTGDIILVEALDHESTRRHVFNVLARNQNMKSYTRLVINVLDVNDHAPKFLSDFVETRVLQTVAIGTVVMKVIAVDEDSGSFGTVRYSIVSGNDQGFFTIDPVLGTVTVAKPLTLDYPEVVLVLKAEDLGLPSSLSDTATARVLVLMSDLSAPRFRQKIYEVDMSENTQPGTYLFSVFAESTTSVRYSLVGGGPGEFYFQVNPNTGAVFLQRHIDYEQHKRLNFTVYAQGTSGFSTEAQVRMNVLDFNDHHPVFERTVYFGTCAENLPSGTIVLALNNSEFDERKPLIVHATDKDAGSNAGVVYQIRDTYAAQYFAVDYGTGALRTKAPLDFEHTAKFSFEVHARDLGSPSLESLAPALVNIDVTDVNDEVPSFSQQRYDAKLYLPTVEGVLVAGVRARDADSTGSLNYVLRGEGNFFRVDASTGDVFVQNADKLEELEKVLTEFELDITVTDGLHEDNTVLRLTVEDLSKRKSDFRFAQRKFDVSVLENVASVQTVLVLPVFGAALGERVTYKLLNQNPYFALNPSSGVLSTTGVPLDREASPKRILVVQARDQRTPPRVAQAIVHVSIQDVNDNRPMFVGLPYYAVAPLDGVHGQNVTQVWAVDQDDGLNGQVLYDIDANRNVEEFFFMERETGIIRLLKQLPANMQNEEFDLEVVASDQGTPPLKNMSVVRVRVINRAMPLFDKPFYSVSVSENATVGSPVITVVGTSSLGGRLVYYIAEGDPDSQFDVEYLSVADGGGPCTILVARPLDFETTTSYSLKLRVVDVKSNLYSDVLVQVTVVDENDCYPQFLNRTYRLIVPETVPVGLPIVQGPMASDLDSGVNAQLAYGLKALTVGSEPLFYIHGTSGTVYLRQPLDFELASEHKLEVVVRDSGLPALSSTATIHIMVSDQNDQPPTFVQLAYTATIHDNAKIGTFVAVVTANDKDTVDQGRQRYAIMAGNEDGLFSVDAQSGIVVVAGSLLHARSVALNISVTDSVHTNYCQLSIAILPAVSDAPAFRHSIYRAEVLENLSPNTRVLGIEADGVGSLEFAFGAQYGSLPFRVDEKTGDVFTKRPLDREEKAFYHFSMQVRDDQGRRGMTEVEVIVLDQNDHSPRFLANSFQVTIAANVEKKTVILQVKAMDEDSDDRIEYSLFEEGGATDEGEDDEEGDDTGEERVRNFRINRRTGELFTRRRLDKFANKQFQFFIRATDRGNPPQRAEVRVELFVTSPSDILPNFEHKQYTFSVAEDLTLGSVIGDLKAQYTGALMYKVADNVLGASNVFDVTPDGKLITLEQLDRETCAVYTFYVVATSKDTSPVKASTTLVTVNVRDVNDCEPTFEAVYENIELTESAPQGTKVVLVSAFDLDLDLAGTVRYELSDSLENSTGASLKTFKIDPETGWVETMIGLDRETLGEYKFSVMAYDMGSPKLSVLTPVKVTLRDANDQAPMFEKSVYEVVVPENSALGTVVVTVKAVDTDLSPYNQTAYYITKGNELGHFSVRSNGEVYLMSALDYELFQSYKLTVVATDGVQLASCAVLVVVADINDNPPVCETDFVKLDILEDIAVGTEIYNFLVDDADSGTNSVLTYSVQSDKHFNITDKGGLRVVEALDRETTAEYNLKLVATDRDGLSCYMRVQIFLLDVNDFVPTFEKEAVVVSLQENLPDGPVPLVQVTAMDADLGNGSKLFYSLADTFNGRFKVEEHTGAVLAMKSLDRELMPSYNLSILAADLGRPQLIGSVVVTVNVLDVNDNPPEFVRALYNVSVSEQADVGTVVTTVQAVSRDVGKNALISYHLVGKVALFELDDYSGKLTLIQPLDYEVQSSYLFRVEARDHGVPPLTATAEIQVCVLDENDTPPLFTQQLYTAKVSEDAPLGQRIVQVIANDPDAGKNGQVAYRIDTDLQSRPFSIEGHGFIVIDKQLDREKVANYSFVVVAVDAGSPALSATASVQIELIDVNDNAPTLDSCNLTAVVQENAKVGTELLVVYAQDDDLPHNGGPFRYDLKGTGADAFRIIDGRVVTVKSLKGHLPPHEFDYQLKLRVYDNGLPPLMTECPLRIRLIEESKYPPEIPSIFKVIVNSYNDEYPGGVVAKLKASDQDPLDVVRYKMTRDQVPTQQKLFSLDAADGTLVGLGGLDVGHYEINVTATDGTFNTGSMVELEVNLVDDETLDHSVSMQLAGATPEQFLDKHWAKFQRTISKILPIRPKAVQIVSLQPSVVKEEEEEDGDKRRRLRAIEQQQQGGVDVLFAVRKGHKNSPDGEYYKPKFVERRLAAKVVEFEQDVGLKVVLLVTELCERDTCTHGTCKERLRMDDLNVVTVFTDDASFVSPKHERTYECLCADGYGGQQCNVPISACSREPCPSYQLCIPDESAAGYACVCPPGTTGSACDEKSCADGECTPDATAVQFMSKSYMRYTLASSIHTHLQLALSLKTTASSGTIMFSGGRSDYNLLEIAGGRLQYRFDSGSGEGLVRIADVSVADGRWHTVLITRNGRFATLSLDEKFSAEGRSLGRNEYLNFDSDHMYFGAIVRKHPTVYGQEEVRDGFRGCLGKIYLDGVEIHRTKSNTRYFNVELKCKETAAAGAMCAGQCQNFGTCLTMGAAFRCTCLPRFSGRYCEIDLDPCQSSPCAHGATCENRGNSFFCKCVHDRTGRLCNEIGDFDECLSSPCAHGTCTNLVGGFRCDCAAGWRGTHCNELKNSVRMEGSPWGIGMWELIYVGIAVLVVVLLAIMIAACCWRRNKRKRAAKYKKATYLQNNANDGILADRPVRQDVVPLYNETKVAAEQPPALPPRKYPFGYRHSKLSNLESALSSGLPTVQVRPLSYGERDRIDAQVDNLERARNYGSAADELENVNNNKSMENLMQTFGKSALHRQGKIPVSASANEAEHMRFKSDKLKDLSMPSADSIDRIKEGIKAAEASRTRKGLERNEAPSVNSIQCLSEAEEPTDVYNWDYSDWNSTLGGNPQSSDYRHSMNRELDSEDENAPLPQGVCQLEETDSEYVGDSAAENDELDEPFVPDQDASDDFRAHLLALQRFGNDARKTSPDDPFPLRSLGMFQRHMDKYGATKKPQPPGSSQSERRRLMADDSAAGNILSSDDSDGDSDAAMAAAAASRRSYGFPTSGHFVPKFSDAALLTPAGGYPATTMSSFKDTDGLSTGDLSNLCEIEDSDTEEPLVLGKQQTQV